MNIIMLLLLVLITSSSAQEEIIEGQIALNGYVDSSGKVLLTGYATSESLSYMSFLNLAQYTYDNDTNQLYAVTDMLTTKKAWDQEEATAAPGTEPASKLRRY